MTKPCNALFLGAALALSALAPAQYLTGFEPLNASAAGTLLTGQDSFTLPAGSTDFLVYTYAGNTPGFPVNPTGGAKFAASQPTSTTVFGRGERTMSFGCAAGGGIERFEAGQVLGGGQRGQSEGRAQGQGSAG